MIILCLRSRRVSPWSTARYQTCAFALNLSHSLSIYASWLPFSTYLNSYRVFVPGYFNSSELSNAHRSTVPLLLRIFIISFTGGGRGNRAHSSQWQLIYSQPRLLNGLHPHRCGNAYTAIYYKPYLHNELLAAAS